MTSLRVLGTACVRCKLLVENVKEAAKLLGLEYKLEKVTDIETILQAGVMGLPVLEVDGKVKLHGKVPSIGELITILANCQE